MLSKKGGRGKVKIKGLEEKKVSRRGENMVHDKDGQRKQKGRTDAYIDSEDTMCGDPLQLVQTSTGIIKTMRVPNMRA